MVVPTSWGLPLSAVRSPAVGGTSATAAEVRNIPMISSARARRSAPFWLRSKISPGAFFSLSQATAFDEGSIISNTFQSLTDKFVFCLIRRFGLLSIYFSHQSLVGARCCEPRFT